MSKFSLFLRLILIAVLLCVAYGAYGILPAIGPAKAVSIAPGMSRQQIAQHLHSEGVIRSWIPIWIASLISSSPVQSGDYVLNPNKNGIAILQSLQNGKEQMVIITIPEGWRREQIAKLLKDKGLASDTFLELTKDKEGYLFPDTYFFDPTVTTETIIEKMMSNFDRRTSELKPTAEHVILASIVEREAKTDIERGLIAGIYANRLRINMKLDADPTVQYGKETNLLMMGSVIDSFWKSITVSDYTNVISPYNTYLNVGLPPSAIANPGIKSLQAAIAPSQTDAFYFFHTSEGEIITSRTVDEHNRNKTKYLR